jgi:hypothetical protein
MGPIGLYASAWVLALVLQVLQVLRVQAIAVRCGQDHT